MKRQRVRKALRQEKALYDTVSVTQINLIRELQHSMAHTHNHPGKYAGLQCCNVESSAALPNKLCL